MPCRKSSPSTPETFTELEAHLAGTLRPVTPPRHVAQRLRDRIHMPDPGILRERIASWHRLVLAMAGTMSVMLLIITVARALFHLTGRKT